MLDRLLADAPKEPRGLLLVALVRDAQDNLPAAEVLYRRYLAFHPDAGFALHRRGHILQRRGHDAAACSSRKRLWRSPATRPPSNDFGAALYRMGDVEHALAAFAGHLGVQCQRNPAERITTA